MLPGVDVTITPLEWMFAAYAGHLRMSMVTLKGWKETHGSKRETALARHAHGAVAEFVVSKCLQRYWPGPGVVGAPDVGGAIDVRSSFHDNPVLIIHESDPDDRPFVLVVGTDDPLRFTVVGWIMGRDAKRDDWYRALQPGRPSYCVPIDELRHIYDLKDVA